jgi:hypothetical protein
MVSVVELNMARPRGRRNDPSRPGLRFKQSEIERCIRAAQTMRLPIARIEIDPATGRITITAGNPPEDDPLLHSVGGLSR